MFNTLNIMRNLIYISIFVDTDFVFLYTRVFSVFTYWLYILYIYTLHFMNNLLRYLSKQKLQIRSFHLEKRKKDRT